MPKTTQWKGKGRPDSPFSATRWPQCRPSGNTTRPTSSSSSRFVLARTRRTAAGLTPTRPCSGMKQLEAALTEPEQRALVMLRGCLHMIPRPFGWQHLCAAHMQAGAHFLRQPNEHLFPPYPQRRFGRSSIGRLLVLANPVPGLQRKWEKDLPNNMRQLKFLGR